MNYAFCDLFIRTDPIALIQNSIYNLFRTQENKSDCFIHTDVVDHIDMINAGILYENIQGIKITMDHGIEYRYYSNIFTGRIQQVLIDDGGQRLLQIARESTPLNEMQFLNCLAPEKYFMSSSGLFFIRLLSKRKREPFCLLPRPRRGKVRRQLCGINIAVQTLLTGIAQASGRAALAGWPAVCRGAAHQEL